MKEGHVRFYFMCKLYVAPQGIESYYTVCSSISISIERLFLLVLRKTVEISAPARGVCKGRTFKSLFASWKEEKKTPKPSHVDCTCIALCWLGKVNLSLEGRNQILHSIAES